MAIHIVNGVPGSELVAGYREDAGRRGLGSSKRWITAWRDRYAFANGLLGVGTQVPALHPDSPNMVPMDVEIEGMGRCTDGPNQLEYEYAVISTRFGVPDWLPLASQDPPGDFSFPDTKMVFATQRLIFSSETMTIPGWGVKFSNGDKIDRDYGFPISQTGIEITLHRLDYLPAALCFDLENAINDAPFLGGATGHVIYNGAQTEQAVMSNGERSTSATYKFTHRKIARWDYALNPKTGSWLQVQLRNGTDAGTSILRTADLSSLFPDAYRY